MSHITKLINLKLLTLQHILLLVIFTALSYICYLFVVNQTLAVRAEEVEFGNGGGRYISKYGDEKSYRCRNNAVIEEYGDGTTQEVKKCGTDTCYALDNQVKGEYVAACLYNPPASSVVGGSCPTKQELDTNRSLADQCKFLNPSIDIFDTSISRETTLTTYAKLYLSAAQATAKERNGGLFVDGAPVTEANFKQRAGIIFDASVRAGLNPAIFLGYWRTESLFSTWPNSPLMGCAPEASGVGQTLEEQVACAVGDSPGGAMAVQCARSVVEKDPQKKASFTQACNRLKALREDTGTYGGYEYSNAETYKDYPLSYPIRTFDDLAEGYGSISPKLIGPNERRLNNGKSLNCNTYNNMIDVIVSIGACKTSAVGAFTPPDTVLSRYDLSISGFAPAEEQIIKQKLSDVSGTRLLNLVKGTQIIKAPGVISFAKGCDNTSPKGIVELAYANHPMLLNHELGHIVMKCNSDEVSGYVPKFEAVYNEEKAISDYSKNVGSGLGKCPAFNASNKMEDYAEMIGFYLNRNATDLGECTNATGANPFGTGDTSTRFPKHFNLVKEILGPRPNANRGVVQ